MSDKAETTSRVIEEGSGIVPATIETPGCVSQAHESINPPGR
jgi:hypothetical protein